MKRKHVNVTGALAVAASLFISGCWSGQQPRPTQPEAAQTSALTGALFGAVSGAAMGAASGLALPVPVMGPTIGLGVGGVLGALGGYQLSIATQNQELHTMLTEDQMREQDEKVAQLRQQTDQIEQQTNERQMRDTQDETN
jgi:uncharacterized membrane protein